MERKESYNFFYFKSIEEAIICMFLQLDLVALMSFTYFSNTTMCCTYILRASVTLLFNLQTRADTEN